MIDHKRVTLRLPPTSIEKLDLAAKASGLTRNELIVAAISSFLDMAKPAPANLNRIAQTTEFISCALDLIIGRDMPDQRGAIHKTVAHRMEQLHGAR